MSLYCFRITVRTDRIFELEVEKFYITEFEESTKYSTDISCKNRDMCARIAANLEKRLNDRTRNDTED